MITKEQIINILEEHTFKVYQHGDVVAKSDFDSIADCIVKNLNISAVIKCDWQGELIINPLTPKN